MPVYRTAGAWGAGKGSNLTPAEVDGNFYELRTDLDDVIANPPTAVGIANVEASGLNWIVTLTDSTILSPVPIPVPVFRFRGAWAAFTLYSELDSFTVAGQGLFTTLVAHTSAAVFDSDATTGSPPETLYQQIFPADLTATLADLADVQITLSGSPAAAGNNDFIAYDLGAGMWTNRTPTAVTALLDAMEGDTGSPGGGAKGLVPAPADGDAAAGKYLDAAGAWTVPPTIGFLGDLGDVDTTGAAAGDFLSYAGSPIEWQPVSPLAISGLTDATLPLDQDSLVEVSEALGSPITYTSAKVRVADLAITLGSTALALGSTVTTVAGLTLNSPTLVTPALGTPASGVATNLTGLPISTGLTGAGTGVLAALAVNVGSAGAFVTFNGALGTPSSGTLTNATGLPVSTGISGLGAGVATFLATPSSANLASAVTGETGSGALVFGTAPTIDGLTLTGTTTLPSSGQISSAGELGLLTSPGALLDLGSYTSANAIVLRMAGSLVSSAASQIGLSVGTAFVPSGASLTTAQGLTFSPVINGSAFSVTNFYGGNGSLTLQSGFTGTVGTGVVYRAGSVSITGTATMTNFNQFQAITSALNDGKTSGTSTIRQFLGSGITSAPNGATLNLRCAEFTVPSGVPTSGILNADGVLIVGNAGAGAVAYALRSTSTAYSRIEGGLGVGLTTRNATTATSPYFYIPTCAGTPTGVPTQAAVGATAMVFDDTAHKLWVYEQSTATWKGVVVA